MKRLSYASALLCALVPALAAGQDSVHVVVEPVEYPAYVVTLVPPTISEQIGPLPLVQTEPFDACAPIQNPNEIEGAIAFVTRGICSFTTKVEHAHAAGASVVVMMNNDQDNPDSIVCFCAPPFEEVEIPMLMVSHNSGLALLDALPTDATLMPIRVGVSTEGAPPPGEYRLEAVYPNPAVSQVQIDFGLPRAEPISLRVYDALGREVAALVDGMQPTGEQSVVFDGADLPSGVYLVRLKAGTTQLVRRLTLVR